MKDKNTTSTYKSNEESSFKILYAFSKYGPSFNEIVEKSFKSFLENMKINK